MSISTRVMRGGEKGFSADVACIAWLEMGLRQLCRLRRRRTRRVIRRNRSIRTIGRL